MTQQKRLKDREQHPHHNVACEQALRGALAAGREKEGELATTALEFEFHLHFPCSFLSTKLSDFREVETIANVNKH